MNSRSALPRRRIKVHDGYVFIERRKRKKNRVMSHVSSVSISPLSRLLHLSFSFYFVFRMYNKFFGSVELRKEQQLSMTGSQFDSYLESILTWSKIIFTINSFQLVLEYHEFTNPRFIEVYNHINY